MSERAAIESPSATRVPLEHLEQIARDQAVAALGAAPEEAARRERVRLAMDTVHHQLPPDSPEELVAVLAPILADLMASVDGLRDEYGARLTALYRDEEAQRVERTRLIDAFIPRLCLHCAPE